MAHIATTNKAACREIDTGSKTLDSKDARAVMRQNSVRATPIVVKHEESTVVEGSLPYWQSYDVRIATVVSGILSLWSVLMFYLNLPVIALPFLGAVPVLWMVRHVLVKALQGNDEIAVQTLIDASDARRKQQERIQADKVLRFVAWCQLKQTYQPYLSILDFAVSIVHSAESNAEELFEREDVQEWLSLLPTDKGFALDWLQAEFPEFADRILQRYAQIHANSRPDEITYNKWKHRLGDQAERVSAAIMCDSNITGAYTVWCDMMEQRNHPAFNSHVEQALILMQLVAKVSARADVYVNSAQPELEIQAASAHAGTKALAATLFTT